MLIFAHRGARGSAPENTMAAFETALQANADGIELDVQLTKDGQLVICHDHTIDRTSNGSGWIKDLTLQQLKTYDFGSWFHPQFSSQRIVSLYEFLTWFAATPLLLNIEIKNGPVIYPDIEEKVIHAIHNFGISSRTIVSSFFHPSLKKIKQLDSTIKTGILFECRPLHPLQFIIDTNADFLHPCWQSLDTELVQTARSAGIGVNTYTVNTAEEYCITSRLGVTAIFTDYPERFSTRV